MFSKGNEGVFTLFVDNLPINMTNSWLKQLFRNDGEVTDAFVSKKKRKGVKGLFGFVRFKREVEASKAIRRNNNLEIKGKKLVVNWSKYARKGEMMQGVRSQGERASNRVLPSHRCSFAEVVKNKVGAHQFGDEREGQRGIFSGGMVMEKHSSKWVEMEERELVKEWVKRLLCRGCIEEKLVVEVEGKEVVIHSLLSNLNGVEKVKEGGEDSKPMFLDSEGEGTTVLMSKGSELINGDRVGEEKQDECNEKRALLVNNGEGKELSKGTAIIGLENDVVISIGANEKSQVSMKLGDNMDNGWLGSGKCKNHTLGVEKVEVDVMGKEKLGVGVDDKYKSNLLEGVEWVQGEHIHGNDTVQSNRAEKQALTNKWVSDFAIEEKKHFKEKDIVKESLEHEVSIMREEYLQILSQKDENMSGKVVATRRSTRKRVPKVFRVGRKVVVI